MLIPCGDRRILSVPVVPFLTGFLVFFYIAKSFTGLSLPLLLSVTLPVSVLGAFSFALPWLLMFYRQGEDLLVRGLKRTQSVCVAGSRYRLSGNKLQLCSSEDKNCVALLPYPRERTRSVVEKLNRHLGLPAQLDASFGQAENGKRRWEIIIGTCVVLILLMWFVSVSQTMCDPGSDCSASGVLSTLFSGIRETIGMFRDLFLIAMGKV